MRKRDIFVGNINKCTKRDFIPSADTGADSLRCSTIGSEVYKENAILIRLGKNTYADLENIYSHFHYVYLKSNHNNGVLQSLNLVLQTVPSDYDSLFVDESTLKPYENLICNKENVSVKKLKMKVSTQKN